MTWPLAKLGDVCQQARLSIKPGHSAELPYIGLECIEAGTGCLLVGEMSKTPESPQANSFGFDQRHVLYGKLRPYLNKVALPDAPGKCSTEIIPLLPNARLDRRYLAYFLRNAATVDRISEKVSGARMPRADMSVVFDLELPLPPLPEQRRIVDLLTRAEGIVRLRREAAAKAAELIPALFIHHFGDPDNADPQTLATLGSVLSRPIRNGISPSKAGKHPGKVLTLSAITRGRFDETAVKDSEFASPIADTDMVSSLDLLVCRGNGNKALVGAACFAPRDMPGVAFPDTAIAVRPDQSVVLPSYLETLWATAFIRRQIDAIAKTTNGTYKINQTGLASIRFPVPPLERQRTFGSTLMQVKGLIAQQSTAEAKAQAAFDALLAQAFSPSDNPNTPQE